MSSIKKNNLVVNSFIFFALILYFVSGFLPVAGAITGQKLGIEDNGSTGVAPNLDKVIAQRPASVQGLIEKGHALNSFKKHELSIACYNDALKIDPNSSPAWYGKGCSLAELGKNEEAINCYEKALLTFQDSSGNWSDKGDEHFKLKKYIEAINCYNKSFVADISPQYGIEALVSEQLGLEQETQVYENLLS